jgi:hypothetical protein
MLWHQIQIERLVSHYRQLDCWGMYVTAGGNNDPSGCGSDTTCNNVHAWTDGVKHITKTVIHLVHKNTTHVQAMQIAMVLQQLGLEFKHPDSLWRWHVHRCQLKHNKEAPI